MEGIPKNIGLIAAAAISGLVLILGIAACATPIFTIEVVSTVGTTKYGVSAFTKKYSTCSFDGPSDFESEMCNLDNAEEIDKDNECTYQSRFSATAAFCVMGTLVAAASAAFHCAKMVMPSLPLPGMVGPLVPGIAGVLFLISWAIAAGTLNFACTVERNGEEYTDKSYADQGVELGPMFGCGVAASVFCSLAVGASYLGNCTDGAASAGSGTKKSFETSDNCLGQPMMASPLHSVGAPDDDTML